MAVVGDKRVILRIYEFISALKIYMNSKPQPIVKTCMNWIAVELFQN